MMTGDSPPELAGAIEAELADWDLPALRRSAQELSEQYRRGGRESGPGITSLEAAAYVAYRMPATYAAIDSVLREIKARLPAWQPESLLDAGAGSGAGLWAAHTRWNQIKRCSLIDKQPAMIDIGRRLAGSLALPSDARLDWRQQGLGADTVGAPFDLVMSSYVLNELWRDDLSTILDWLWSQTAGTLVIVEPGTPDGFSVIREARRWLIDHGADVIAPCPHADRCPMDCGDWCHFSVRLRRSRIHRAVKPGDLAYEDEKFSYVAAVRFPADRADARILRHPSYGRGLVRLTLCTNDGVVEGVVSRRRDRDHYRIARSASWGESFPSS